MYLRLVCTCAHDPLPIIADSDALTGFFELEVLEKLDAIGVLGIVLQASFSLSCKPFWKWSSGGRAGDGIDWYSRMIADLHSEDIRVNLHRYGGKKFSNFLQCEIEFRGKSDMRPIAWQRIQPALRIAYNFRRARDLRQGQISNLPSSSCSLLLIPSRRLSPPREHLYCLY